MSKGTASEPTSRLFHLVREEDISGVSGTGVVAEGIEFTNGMCAVGWLGSTPSVNIYQNMKCVNAVHGHGGATRVVWK